MEKISNFDNISASHLQQDKVYEYKYNGVLTVGASNELPVSALEFSSTVKITGDSDQKYFIQVRVAACVTDCGACASCNRDKTGCILDKLLVYCRANEERQTTIHSHILSI